VAHPGQGAGRLYAAEAYRPPARESEVERRGHVEEERRQEVTGEEMERAIDFLLKSQANLEQRIEQVNSNLSARIAEVTAQVGETNLIVGQIAETQNQFIETVTRTFEEQAEFNRRTDVRINALVGAVEKLISDRNGKG
jgi:DNA anti-recombination protein RmuC